MSQLLHRNITTGMAKLKATKAVTSLLLVVRRVHCFNLVFSSLCVSNADLHPELLFTLSKQPPELHWESWQNALFTVGPNSRRQAGPEPYEPASSPAKRTTASWPPC